MRKSGKSILYLTIIILSIVIFILIGIIINISNTNKDIKKQEESASLQLEETTDNTYVSMETHMSELSAKQEEIDNIQNTSGQATATADKILKDYTAYKNGQLITGTMENRGAWTNTPTTSGKITIPAGYHNGSGYVDTSEVYNAGYMASVGDERLNLSNISHYNIGHTHQLDSGITISNSITPSATNFKLIVVAPMRRISRSVSGTITISGSYTDLQTIKTNSQSASNYTMIYGVYQIEKSSSSSITITVKNTASDYAHVTVDAFVIPN